MSLINNQHPVGGPHGVGDQEAAEPAAPAAEAEGHVPAAAAGASGSLLASRGAQHASWLSKMWDGAKHEIAEGEQKVLDVIEPENTTGLVPPPPAGIGVGALNIAETALARMHLMFVAKPYTKWVEQGKLMRGSEPNSDGFKSLKQQGVKTVVNLRYESNDEKKDVEKLGMKNVWIPVYDQSLPSKAEVQKFLDVVKNPANQPVYVHCEQGVGRTGIMAAAYRLGVDGWSADQAVAEAKQMGMASSDQEAFIRQMATDIKAGKYT